MMMAEQKIGWNFGVVNEVTEHYVSDAALYSQLAIHRNRRQNIQLRFLDNSFIFFHTFTFYLAYNLVFRHSALYLSLN